MKKLLNLHSVKQIAFIILVGFIICLFTTSSFVQILIERAIQTHLNPLDIRGWIWIFIGS